MKTFTSNTTLKDSEDYKGYGYKKPLPKTFPISRALTSTIAKAGNTIPTLFPELNTGAEGIVITGDRKLTDYTFYALCYGFSRALFNQSYQKGNKANEGISKTDDEKLQAISKRIGEELYSGNIKITLSELCYLSFGHKPDTKEREKVKTMLELLDTEKIGLDLIWADKIPEADKTTKLKRRLIAIWDEEIKGNGEIDYSITLHPYFSYNITSSYGLVPQDFATRLSQVEKKKDERYYKLLFFLSKNIRGKEVKYYKSDILDLLDMRDTYKKDKTRTENTLHKYFDNLVKIGYLEKWTIAETEIIRNKESITRYSFIVCSNFDKMVVPSAEKNGI